MAYIYFAFDVLVQLLYLSRVFKNTSFERLNANQKDFILIYSFYQDVTTEME